MDSSTIQSVAFERELWTPSDAKEWLKNHNFIPIKKVHPNRRFLRYRLAKPAQFRTFHVKVLPDGVRLILGIK